MKNIYKYVYTLDEEVIKEKGSHFYVETIALREDQEHVWCTDYWYFEGVDYGIDKEVVDNWDRELSFFDFGRVFWSFNNDEETMRRFKNAVKDIELESFERLKKTLENVKERLKVIYKELGEETNI